MCEQFMTCISEIKRIQIFEKSKKKKGKKVTKKPRFELSAPSCNDRNSQSRCIQSYDDRSKVKCEEIGKTYILENTAKRNVARVHIDGGVIDSQDCMKCDYGLFINPIAENAGIAILVELKGKDTKHALNQLISTLQLSPFKNLSEVYSHIYGRIVCTGNVPNIQSTDEFLDAKECFASMGGNVRMREYYFEEKIENL